MKRKTVLVLLILSLFLGTVNVWAEEEEVWTPNDAFYVENAEECVLLNREYLANGPHGKVIMYESPASCQVIQTMENENIVLIDYTYKNADGIEWGLCEFRGKYGWIPMPYMVLVYDGISFEEDYGEQIEEKLGSIPSKITEEMSEEEREIIYFFDKRTDRYVRLWTYPGSTRCRLIKLDYWYWQDNMPGYKKVFVDEDGRSWGFVSYYGGEDVNSWMCIDSVLAVGADYEELYPDGGPNRDTRVITAYEGEEIFPDDYEDVQMMKKVKQAVSIAGIIVIVVVIAIFYRKLWKKVKAA